MNSPGKGTDELPSRDAKENDGPEASGDEKESKKEPRPPAKRRLSATVIEISDTESDDSDVCAVNSYQASADEVKRIRGADYSSASSTTSSDYSSDSESPWDDDSILLEDEKKDVEVVHAELNTRANRMDDPKINNKLKSQVLLETLSNNWKDRKDYSDSEVTLTCEPFRVCLLHELLDNPEIINNIVDDMNTLDWSRKKMDLYEFHQTADLASLTWQRSIRGIYELLKTEVMTWVSQVTGVELTTVSASCSLYGPGDHLLVHDDLLGDRRVAFILYLAPWKLNKKNSTSARLVENGANGGDQHKDKGWAESLGGALELVARDECGRPTEVVRSIYPRNNMLALFQVGTDSFHQVGEVLSLELPRLSINGWFHGPTAEETVSLPTQPSPLPTPQKPHSEIVLLNEWVSSAYMSARTRLQIQQQMEADSEVCLKGFLHKHRYDAILAALHEVPWERYGPSDRRRCERAPEGFIQDLPKGNVLRELLNVFTGTAFFRLLTDCTDLTLSTHQHLELKRWSPGDYALLPSRERYTEARLEAIVYLGVPEGSQSGSTVYVAPEEEGSGALVTLPPVNNALNLVYCDAGAASFTKYLSRIAARGRRFYTLACTYRENGSG